MADARTRRAARAVSCPEDVLAAALEAARAGQFEAARGLLSRVDCKLQLTVGRRALRRHSWPSQRLDSKRRGYWWGASSGWLDRPPRRPGDRTSSSDAIHAIGDAGQVWADNRQRKDAVGLRFHGDEEQPALLDLLAYLQERAVEWRWRPEKKERKKS